jgi:hypothetical protein
MDNLESRIRALEASNRRQRYSITALAAIIVGGALIAATRPVGDATFDNVTCKTWRVVDDSGKPRIAALSKDGTAGMFWYDKDGKMRLIVATQNDGKAGTWYLDNNQKNRIIAVTQSDGSAETWWLDQDEKKRRRDHDMARQGCATPDCCYH